MNETQLSAADLLPLTQAIPIEFDAVLRSLVVTLYTSMVQDLRADLARAPLQPYELVLVAQSALAIVLGVRNMLGGGVLWVRHAEVLYA